MGLFFLALALGMAVFFIWLDSSQVTEGKFISPDEATQEAISRGVPTDVARQYLEIVQNIGSEPAVLLASTDRSIRISLGEIEHALAWGATNASILINKASAIKVVVNGGDLAGSLVAPVPDPATSEEPQADVEIELTVQPKHWEDELTGVGGSTQAVLMDAKFVAIPSDWQHSLINGKANMDVIYARPKEAGFVNTTASFAKDVQFYFVSQEEFDILNEVFPEKFSERMGWIAPSLIFFLILAPFAWLFWAGYIKM